MGVASPPRGLAPSRVADCGRYERIGRRAVTLQTLLVASQALAAEDMRTSGSISSYKDLTGEPGSSLGAGAISGKSRPRTGVCLLEPVQSVQSSSTEVAVQSLLALDGGVAASVRFLSPFPVAKGFYIDVETRSKDGDAAFLQVERLPSAESVASVATDWIISKVLSSEGRFGAFGTPSDVSVLGSFLDQGKRYVDVQFSALTPNGAESQRRALVSAITPPGSQDAVLLVTTTSRLRWGKVGPRLRQIADSLTVDNVRATKIPRTVKSDYRFSEGTLFQ